MTLKTTIFIYKCQLLVTQFCYKTFVFVANLQGKEQQIY